MPEKCMGNMAYDIVELMKMIVYLEVRKLEESFYKIEEKHLKSFKLFVL